MLEKIGTPEYQYLSEPCGELIDLLERTLANASGPVSVAEIGVGIGATSREIAGRLRKGDRYYFFSFADDAAELEKDLLACGIAECELIPMGNSRALYDAYYWNLALMALRKENLGNMFDLVFLDGAHTLCFCGMACVLVKKLMRPGGFFVFDDVLWSFENSPDLNSAVNPGIYELFSREQAETPQVEMIVKLFMEDDKEWIRYPSVPDRAVFRKKGGGRERNLTAYYAAGIPGSLYKRARKRVKKLLGKMVPHGSFR